MNLSSAVCEARQPSLSSLRTMSSPGVPPGTMNSAWPRWPSSSSTTALTTCTLAMPPLPIHILWPSMIQSASGPGAIPARPGAQVAHVAAALGFGDRQRGQLQIAGRTEALRRPLQHLLGRGGLPDRRQRQRRHHDGQADAGAPPEQLLHEHRQRQARGVADQVAVEQRAVEAPAGRLLQHRPRELLALVVVGGHRADHLFGELVGAPGQIVLRRGRREVEGHETTTGIDIRTITTFIGPRVASTQPG